MSFDHKVVALYSFFVDRAQVLEDNLYPSLVVIVQLFVYVVPLDAGSRLDKFRIHCVDCDLGKRLVRVVLVRRVHRAVACVVAHDERYVPHHVLIKDDLRRHFKSVIYFVKVPVVHNLANLRRTHAPQAVASEVVHRVLLVVRVLRVALAVADKSHQWHVVAVTVRVAGKVFRLRYARHRVDYREGVFHVAVIERRFMLRHEVVELWELILYVYRYRWRGAAHEAEDDLVLFVCLKPYHSAARVHVNRVVPVAVLAVAVVSRVIFDQHHRRDEQVLLRRTPVGRKPELVARRVGLDVYVNALVAVAAVVVRRFCRNFYAHHRAPARPVCLHEVERRTHAVNGVRHVGIAYRGQVYRTFRRIVADYISDLGLRVSAQAVVHLAVNRRVGRAYQPQHSRAAQRVPVVFDRDSLLAGTGLGVRESGHGIAHGYARYRVSLTDLEGAHRVLGVGHVDRHV